MAQQWTQQSETSSIRHTGFSNKDKPETASDFAVPDIKPHYKQHSHMNTTFNNNNTQLFSMRN